MRLALARLAVLLPLALASPAARPAAAADLQLNEILAGPARDWDGSGAFSSRDDEWIEVKNVGSGSLDLGGFLITDGDSIPRYALSGVLAAGERLVVYGRMSYDWERANGFPAFGLSLANTGDQALLFQVAAGETLLVDSYSYRSHEAAADRSVARDGDTEAWILFDGLNPYTGSTPPFGNGCPPTPTRPNLCDVTPGRPTSWGAVKAIYR